MLLVESCPDLPCSICVSSWWIPWWSLIMTPRPSTLWPPLPSFLMVILLLLSPEIGSPAFSSSLPSHSLSQLFIDQSEMTKQFLHDIETRDAWPCHGPHCRQMSGHRNQHLNTPCTRPTTQHSYMGCRSKHSILHGSPLSRKVNDSKIASGSPWLDSLGLQE